MSIDIRNITGMHGPFAAPINARPQLLRGRLLERLQARWSVPVVSIVAGAGFGKTTVLAQVQTENLLDPRGEDRWLSCSREDNGATTLGSHLAGALGLAPLLGHDVTCEELADAIATRSPHHVALLLDDVHHVDPSGTGAQLLQALVGVLPSNGHLVLAGRRAPPVASARLRSQGRAVVITEAEMAFDADEVAAFATLRLADPLLIARAAGWPALAELHAVADREAALDFLWEELLATMPESRRRDLAVLSSVGREIGRAHV